MGTKPRLSAVLALFLASALPASPAERKTEGSEPKLLSAFPSVGQPNTKVRSQIRANWIGGAYAVWFEDKGLRGQVLNVEEIPPETAPHADNSDVSQTFALPI